MFTTLNIQNTLVELQLLHCTLQAVLQSSESQPSTTRYTAKASSFNYFDISTLHHCPLITSQSPKRLASLSLSAQTVRALAVAVF